MKTERNIQHSIPDDQLQANSAADIALVSPEVSSHSPGIDGTEKELSGIKKIKSYLSSVWNKVTTKKTKKNRSSEKKVPYKVIREQRQAERATDAINLVSSEAKKSEKLEKISQEIKNKLPINDKMSVMLEAASHFPSIAKEISGVQEVKKYLLSLNIRNRSEEKISIDKIESFGILLQEPQKQLVRRIKILSRKKRYDSAQQTIDLLVDSISDTDRLWKLLLQTSELPDGITESIGAVMSSIKLQECMRLIGEKEGSLNKNDRKKLRALVLEEFLPTPENNNTWFSPLVIKDIIEGKSDLNDPWISGNIFESYLDFQENVAKVKKRKKLSKASNLIISAVFIMCIGGNIAAPYISNYFEKEKTSISEFKAESKFEFENKIFLPFIANNWENISETATSEDNLFEQYGEDRSSNINQEDSDKLIREFIESEYEKYVSENAGNEILSLEEYSKQKMNELTEGELNDLISQILAEYAREGVRNNISRYLFWYYENNLVQSVGSYTTAEEFIEHKMSDLNDDDLLSLLEKYQENEQEINEFFTLKENRRKAELELRANYKDYIADGYTFNETEDEYVDYILDSIADWYVNQLADDYDQRVRRETNYSIVENSLRAQYQRDHEGSGESDSSFEDLYVNERMSQYNESQIDTMANRLIDAASVQDDELYYNGIDSFEDFALGEQQRTFDESTEQLSGNSQGNLEGSPNFSDGSSPENGGEVDEHTFWTIHGEIPSTYFRASRSDTFNSEMRWEANSSDSEIVVLPSKGLNIAATEIVSTFGASGRVDIPIPGGHEIEYAQYEGTEADNTVSAEKRTDGSYTIQENRSVLTGTRILIGFNPTDEYLLGDAVGDRYLDNSILLPNPELLPKDTYNELVRIRDSSLSSSEKAQQVKVLHESIFTYSLDTEYSDYFRSGPADGFVLRVIDMPLADCDVQNTAGVSFLRFVGVRSAISSGFANSQALLDTNSGALDSAEGHGWAEFFNEETQQWEAIDMTTSSSMDSGTYYLLSEAHDGGAGGGEEAAEFDKLIEEVIQTPATMSDIKLEMLKALDFSEMHKKDIALLAGMTSFILGLLITIIGEKKTLKRKARSIDRASELIQNTYGPNFYSINNLLQYVSKKTKQEASSNVSWRRDFISRVIPTMITMGISNWASRIKIKKETERLEERLDKGDFKEYWDSKKLTYMPMGRFFTKLLGLKPKQVVEKITKDNIGTDLRGFQRSVNRNITKRFREELKNPKFMVNLDKTFFKSIDLHDFLSRVTDEYYQDYLKAKQNKFGIVKKISNFFKGKKNKEYKKEKKLSKIDFAKEISGNYGILITYWKLQDNRQRMIAKASGNGE